MARPQKFRHSNEALNDPQIAEKLGRLVLDIESLRMKREQIDTQIAAAFDAVDDAGFDKKFVRKVVSLRAKDGDARRDEEAGIEAYEFAVEKGVSLASARRKHENVDPETGEVLDERRSDNGLNIQTKHEDIRTAPETAEELLGGFPVAAAETNAEETGGVDAEKIEYPKPRLEKEQIAATNSEKATVATQGEATAPTSDERVSLPVDDRSDSAANAGGDHVDGNALRVPTSNTGEGAANTALPDTIFSFEYVPPVGMKRLPFAHCFPELSSANYALLENDIVSNRVHVPIVRQGDVIVDGWNRYTIARRYGFSYPVIEYTGTDVLLDVIEWQRAARNFTPAQEKKIAADLAKEIPHRADDILAAFGLAEALEAAQ